QKAPQKFVQGANIFQVSSTEKLLFVAAQGRPKVSDLPFVVISGRPRKASRASPRQKEPVSQDPRAQSSPASPPRRMLRFRTRPSGRESGAGSRRAGWRSGRNSRVLGPPAWRPRRARFLARRAPAP